jgi:hypothetical protein
MPVKRAAVRTWLRNYKAKHPCVICGEDDPRCIDFHHNAAGEKVEKISNLATKVSIKRLKKELERCTPLCANCHRKLHADCWGAFNNKGDKM